jgi:hypothetical protein
MRLVFAHSAKLKIFAPRIDANEINRLGGAAIRCKKSPSALLRPGPGGSIKKKRQFLDRPVGLGYDFQNNAPPSDARASHRRRATRDFGATGRERLGNGIASR